VQKYYEIEQWQKKQRQDAESQVESVCLFPATFGKRFGTPVASVSITELVQEKFMKPAGGMPLINRKATVCKAKDDGSLQLQLHCIYSLVS
jgi:hypothetical protein